MIGCQVCGGPATVYVIIECADGDIVGPLCDDHADDIEPHIAWYDWVGTAPSEEQPAPINEQGEHLKWQP